VFYLSPAQAALSPAPDWPAEFARLLPQARDPRLRAYYGAGVPAAATPLAEVPLLALDFETTGLDARRDGIVSIGLIPLRIDRIRCGGSQHWLVKPRARLRSESVVIHGITHSEIDAAPDLEILLAPLLEAMAGRVMVVHYAGIERRFLDAALRERLGEGIRFPVIDTLELEARLHRRRHAGFFARLLGRSPTSIRLNDSRQRYHLPHYHSHNALTDALACAELLQAQVAHRFSPDTPVAQLWS